jgi:hypothetical protein
MTKYSCDFCKEDINAEAPLKIRIDANMHDACFKCWEAIKKLVEGTGEPVFDPANQYRGVLFGQDRIGNVTPDIVTIPTVWTTGGQLNGGALLGEATTVTFNASNVDTSAYAGAAMSNGAVGKISASFDLTPEQVERWRILLGMYSAKPAHIQPEAI